MTDEQIRRELIRRKRARKRRTLNILRLLIVILAVAIAVYGGIFIGNKRYEKDIATRNIDDNNPMVKTAVSQATTKNNKGDKFWSWYGYDSHVPWCATFVSWCANENSLLKDGTVIKYADCVPAVKWFKSKGKWLDGGEVPKGGDIIFFDWEGDGWVDHTGIVTGVVDDKVFTVEGNSSDRCRRKRYDVKNPAILGYGVVDIK